MVHCQERQAVTILSSEEREKNFIFDYDWKTVGESSSSSIKLLINCWPTQTIETKFLVELRNNNWLIWLTDWFVQSSPPTQRTFVGRALDPNDCAVLIDKLVVVGIIDELERQVGACVWLTRLARFQRDKRTGSAKTSEPINRWDVGSNQHNKTSSMVQSATLCGLFQPTVPSFYNARQLFTQSKR